MTRHTIEASPQRHARLCGAIYLAVIVLGGFSEGFITNQLIVPGDITTSARNILAAQELWAIGTAANLLVVILAIPQLWLEYLLLRPVNKNLVLLSVLFGVISLATESVSKLFLFLVTPAITNTSYLTAFEPEQLQVLANLALRAHGVAFNIALIFFAFACLLNGHLIYRSGYLPKLTGALLQLAGLAYLIACFSELFFPALARYISPAIFAPILIGEASICLWLLVKGVNTEKWRDRISARRSE